MWKLANGFKVSFTELMSKPQPNITIVKKSDITPLIEDDGKVRNFPLFSFDPKRRFEMYSLEIDPTGYIKAEAHPTGSQEFISVFSGTLTIKSNNQTFELATDDSIHFKADTPHTYLNSGTESCKLSMIIYYPD